MAKVRRHTTRRSGYAVPAGQVIACVVLVTAT